MVGSLWPIRRGSATEVGKEIPFNFNMMSVLLKASFGIHVSGENSADKHASCTKVLVKGICCSLQSLKQDSHGKALSPAFLWKIGVRNVVVT